MRVRVWPAEPPVTLPTHATSVGKPDIEIVAVDGGIELIARQRGRADDTRQRELDCSIGGTANRVGSIQAHGVSIRNYEYRLRTGAPEVVSHPGKASAYAIIGDCGDDLHELLALAKVGGIRRAGIIEPEDHAGFAEADPEIALRIESGGVGEELRSSKIATCLAGGKCAG